MESMLCLVQVSYVDICPTHTLFDILDESKDFLKLEALSFCLSSSEQIFLIRV